MEGRAFTKKQEHPAKGFCSSKIEELTEKNESDNQGHLQTHQKWLSKIRSGNPQEWHMSETTVWWGWWPCLYHHLPATSSNSIEHNWTRKSSAETLHTSGLQVIDSSMDLQFASGNLPSAAQLKWGLTIVKLAKEVTMIDHVSKLFDTTCT